MLYDLGWILVYGLGFILRESAGVSVRHGISPCVHASDRSLNSLFWETDYFSGNEDVKILLKAGRDGTPTTTTFGMVPKPCVLQMNSFFFFYKKKKKKKKKNFLLFRFARHGSKRSLSTDGCCGVHYNQTATS